MINNKIVLRGYILLLNSYAFQAQPFYIKLNKKLFFASKLSPKMVTQNNLVAI